MRATVSRNQKRAMGLVFFGVWFPGKRDKGVRDGGKIEGAEGTEDM